jgi:hypothetical protein
LQISSLFFFPQLFLRPKTKTKKYDGACNAMKST